MNIRQCLKEQKPEPSVQPVVASMMLVPYFAWTQLLITAAIILFLQPGTTAASEPLRGPEVGGQLWRAVSSSSDSSSTNGSESNSLSKKQLVKNRFFNADIPLPVPLWIAMPFSTIRLRDRSVETTPAYFSDNKIGLGLLHHAAEGDPAWRLDVARGGPINATPSVRTRLIASLIKPFPWLRIRPSDNVYSWVGLNYVSRPDERALLIPEFAWYREGYEGLVIDLVAPKHLFFGFRNAKLGFLIGMEQDWVNWRTNDSSEKSSWTIQRLARAKLILAPDSEYVFSGSLLHDMAFTNDVDNMGVEIALQWVPNP